MKKLLCLVLSLFFLPHLLHAQTPATGTYPFASFDTPGFDSINLGNLNTRFTIPIVGRPGRGQAFNYSLQYEGLIWTSANGVWAPDPSWGFAGQLNGTGFVGYLSHIETDIKCSGPEGNHGLHDIKLTNFIYHDAFGGQHRFNYSYQENICTVGDPIITGNGASNDGSGYTLVDQVSVKTRSGATIVPNASPAGGSFTSITDRNGNQISGNGSGTFTDTLGVTALSVSGSNPVNFTYPVTEQANGATTATASLTYQTYTVRTNFGCSGVGEYGSTSISLPNRLTLADGSYYEFSYESTYQATDGAVTGRLSSVRLPTGGTIQYSYTAGCSGAGINADGTVGSLTRVTSNGTRSYGRAPLNGNSTSTTLQDEKGNQALISFTIDTNTQNFYETHRTVHQGNTAQSVLSDAYTCYNGTAAPCDSTAIALPISEVDTTASFNSGSQVLTKNYYDTNGSLLTESDTYSGTTLLKKTQASYNTLGEPLSVTQYDGSNNAYATTTYGYDETGITATSGLPQHTTAASQRGNLTSVHVTGSPNINTSTTYYDTGMPASTTAADGGQTTYTYDSTGAFVTGTALPTPSSGVPLSTSAHYDAYSASLLSNTGMTPGETTSILSYDPTMSPTSVQLPSSGLIAISHDSPTQITTTQPLDSSRTANTKTILDGYGRVSRSSIWNGQSTNSWYNTDYCYDGVGLLAFQSVAYQANSYDPSAVPLHCSSQGTSFSYDALGRKLSKTTADGTTSWSYLDHAVKSVDVSGVGRITQYDALGRISSVCELSTSTLVGTSPTDCGSNIAGTGFLTTYSYNLANHMTQSNQGGQLRTFVTDAAGRPMSVTEPESGATNYSYTYNSTGLVSTRTRPAANQTNAAVQTTTTTQFDLLGRPVSITYSDGTPKRLFFYDINANIGNGFVQTNYIGRLSAMDVQLPNTFSLTGISYDALGRVIGLNTCLPAQCKINADNFVLSYQYDLAGNLLSSGDGSGTTTTYTYSPANEVQSVTSSLSGATSPPTIISNVTNGPNGPLNYSLGNGLTSVFTYDALGRNNLGTVCQGSTAPNCSGGGFVYSYNVQQQGVRTTTGCDTVLNQCFGFGYDEFNRLTSRTVTGGAAQNFTYGYDRYGNRWSQTAANGGPQPQLSFSSATNQIITAGYSYDAAGNLSSDGIHFYTYDAEGNLTAVDGGSTAQYVYDALNRRISSTVAGTTTQFLYNAFGQRVSIWGTASPANQLQEQYFVGNKPVAYFSNNTLHFQHQDWTGTERMRTTYNGAVEGSFVSMPFGDTFSTNGGDGDSYHYAGLDHDYSSNTDHAQFRQYSPMSGRWMSPDPYRGSYRWRNPQSLNRYTYALNNPMNLVDPSGLFASSCDDDDDVDGCGGDGNGDGGVTSGGGGGGGDTYDPTDCNDPHVGCVTTDPTDPPTTDPTDCWDCGVYGGVGGGGASTGSGNGSAPSNGTPTRGQCASQALKSDGNGVSLALDVAGVGAGFLPGGGLVTGSASAARTAFAVQAGLTAASTGVSIAYKSGPGIVAGILGGQVALTAKSAEALAVDLGKALPVAGVFVSAGALVYDGYQTYKAYSGCLTGVHE